jgi:hypothetical protein
VRLLPERHADGGGGLLKQRDPSDDIDAAITNLSLRTWRVRDQEAAADARQAMKRRS